AGDDFIFADEENWPGPDLPANLACSLDVRSHDLGARRSFEADESRRRVADDQQALHPERRMAEDGKEDVDCSEFGTRHRRTVGIAKVGIVDEVAVQRARGWNIAFDHGHIAPYFPQSPEQRYLRRLTATDICSR